MTNNLKIRINQSEVYVISFEKEELTAEEFFGLLERFKEIEKLVAKGNIENLPAKKKHNGGRLKGERWGKRFSWNKDRNKFIEVLKVYYFGSSAEKEKISKEEEADWGTITKNIIYMKKKFNAQPKEVGLKYFPSQRGKTRQQALEQAKITKQSTKAKPKNGKNGKIGKEYNDTN